MNWTINSFFRSDLHLFLSLFNVDPVAEALTLNSSKKLFEKCLSSVHQTSGQPYILEAEMHLEI